VRTLLIESLLRFCYQASKVIKLKKNISSQRGLFCNLKHNRFNSCFPIFFNSCFRWFTFSENLITLKDQCSNTLYKTMFSFNLNLFMINTQISYLNDYIYVVYNIISYCHIIIFFVVKSYTQRIRWVFLVFV